MRIRGVDVYLHWSVLVISGVMLIGAVAAPGMALVGLGAYLSVLLIHEVGHLVAAQNRGCKVFSIVIYPFFGVTEFELPWFRIDHCLIAWSGVLAQLAVSLPFVLWVKMFGYTRFGAVNAALALFGFFSLGVAALNLIPIRPLDGAVAWGIVPAAFGLARMRVGNWIDEWRR